MPTDLHTRATDQQALLEATADEITTALGKAREKLEARHDAPGSVTQAEWAAKLGAVQHRQVARDALEAVRQKQAQVRADLAAVANPADAATFEAQLREHLIDEAGLRVELRLAEERVASAKAEVERLSSLASGAEAEVKAAADRTAWGKERKERGDQLRTALGAPPLDTIVGDADDVRTGTAFSEADGRLDALLPTELRTRAEARGEEAVAVVSAEKEHAAKVQTERDALDQSAEPLRAAVTIGKRDLLAAERNLSDYVGGAAGRLAWAEGVLDKVRALKDLSTAQADAIDAADNADGVDAASHEQDLADAVAAEAAAQRAVNDAILDALLDDPDVDDGLIDDPDTGDDNVTPVANAQDARDAAGIQDPLSTARGNYDAAAQEALDEWEVEVPAELWTALEEFIRARRALQELADQGARDDLVQALDDAEDAVATALDDRDVDTRKRWHLGLADTTRHGRLAAATATATERHRQYVRGDGPGGRTPAEL